MKTTPTFELVTKLDDVQTKIEQLVCYYNDVLEELYYRIPELENNETFKKIKITKENQNETIYSSKCDNSFGRNI